MTKSDLAARVLSLLQEIEHVPQQDAYGDYDYECPCCEHFKHQPDCELANIGNELGGSFDVWESHEQMAQAMGWSGKKLD